MADILPFKSKPDTSHGPLLLTIELYDSPGFTDYVIGRHDGLRADDTLDEVIERTKSLLSFLYLDRFERTKDPAHDLLMTLRISASSDVYCSWLSNDEPPFSVEYLAWLHRRFSDAYWALDHRRGPAYHWHILRGKIRNLLRRQPKDNPK